MPCLGAEMLENLKLALTKQKRLVTIFLLTIFLPSVSLSIFGIRAIKNERFRLAKQLENEHRRAAESLRSRIFSELKELGLTLQNLAESSAFQEKDDDTIAGILRSRLAENPLVEAVFLSSENEEPWFPLFQPAPMRASPEPRLALAGPLQEKLKEAEDYEFIDKNHGNAVSLYRELARQTKDKNWQARMINNESRCLMKLKKYSEAITGYKKISRDYPESLSDNGVSMALISQLQVVQCHRELGDHKRALEACLNLYRDILDMNWNLNEAQFKSYAGLAEDGLAEMIFKTQDGPVAESYKKEYGQLKSVFQEKLKKWAIVRDVQQEIIPELHRKQLSSPVISDLIHYAKTIKDKTFLILAIPIPNKSDVGPGELLGLKINNDALLDNPLAESIKKYPFSDHTNVIISDLEGRTLWGKKNSFEELATTTEFFNDNFPPWKIEFFRSKTEGFGMADLKRSFYFWTILTLVLVLTFGAVMIARTITHELEILKLKSDFVSSVSHEFKTPLTSIKALAERLQDDKVKDSDRMRQYFSLISQNVDRLTQLVRNLLDFSKIEEGKKEYHLAPTDVTELVAQQIRDFENNEFQKGVRVRAQIPEDIPHLVVDREALSQAIQNLLDNALKFSGENKEIEVWIKRQEEHVIIEVRDKGIGIPQDELGKIFDKFYQGRNAVQQSARGTGLGLTLVKHTVEAHGGKVSVSSKVGEGSAFSLILPIKKE